MDIPNLLLTLVGLSLVSLLSKNMTLEVSHACLVLKIINFYLLSIYLKDQELVLKFFFF